MESREATIEDILYSLHDSMADKVASLLEKAQRELKRAPLIGGVARNESLSSSLPLSSECARKRSRQHRDERRLKCGTR